VPVRDDKRDDRLETTCELWRQHASLLKARDKAFKGAHFAPFKRDSNGFVSPQSFVRNNEASDGFARAREALTAVCTQLARQ
jgi:hypothetical protein